jgi:hypothetical protein
MTCDQALENLSAYLDGELPPDEAAAVRAHLDDCPVCLAAERDLRALAGLLARLPEHPAPQDLARGVQQEVRRRARPVFLRRTIRTWLQAAAVAAGVVLVVGVGTVGYLAFHRAGREVAPTDLAAWNGEVRTPTGQVERMHDRPDLNGNLDQGDAWKESSTIALARRFEGKIGDKDAEKAAGYYNRSLARDWAEDRGKGEGDAAPGPRVGGHSLTGDLYAYYDPRREGAAQAAAPAPARLTASSPAPAILTPPAPSPAPAAPPAEAPAPAPALTQAPADAFAKVQEKAKALGLNGSDATTLASATAVHPPQAAGLAARQNGGTLTSDGAGRRDDLKHTATLGDSPAGGRTVVVLTDSRERFGTELAALLAESDGRLALAKEVHETTVAAGTPRSSGGAAPESGEAADGAAGPAVRGRDADSLHGTGRVAFRRLARYENEDRWVVVGGREEIERLAARLTAREAPGGKDRPASRQMEAAEAQREYRAVAVEPAPIAAKPPGAADEGGPGGESLGRPMVVAKAIAPAATAAPEGSAPELEKRSGEPASANNLAVRAQEAAQADKLGALKADGPAGERKAQAAQADKLGELKPAPTAAAAGASGTAQPYGLDGKDQAVLVIRVFEVKDAAAAEDISPAARPAEPAATRESKE